MSGAAPYLAFDFDALEHCAPVGGACGLSEEQVCLALAKLWRFCWRSKTEFVSTTHIQGFFYGKAAADALLAFGFIAATAEGWRVKGADRWLFVQKARSDNGKANAGNLRQGSKPGVNSPGPSRDPPGTPSGNSPALTATNDQRTTTDLKAHTGPQPEELAEVWNDYRPAECPTVRADGLSESRRKHARARLKERPDLETWVETVVRLRQSDFARGLSPRSTWVATFDWLLRPDTATKIDEGSYDGKAKEPFDPNQGILRHG